MSEQVILIAVQVEADTREAAGNFVHDMLETREDHPNWIAYWTAEDDRVETSDCDSAVFVKPGYQSAASQLLNEHGLTDNVNVVEADRLNKFKPQPLEETPV